MFSTKETSCSHNSLNSSPPQHNSHQNETKTIPTIKGNAVRGRNAHKVNAIKKERLKKQISELKEQERLVETLRAQKVTRDAQMLALTNAFNAFRVQNEVASSDEHIHPELRSAADAGSLGSLATEGKNTNCVDTWRQLRPEEDSPPSPSQENKEAHSGEPSPHKADIAKELLAALSSYMSGRQKDFCEREQIGFVPAASSNCHCDPLAPIDSLEEDHRLLQEEEAALLELAQYRAQKKLKKRRKTKSNDVKSSSDSKQNEEYEDDFEEEVGEENELPVDETIEQRTRTEVVAKLLEEFIEENKSVELMSSGPPKIVGLSWLDDEGA